MKKNVWLVSVVCVGLLVSTGLAVTMKNLTTDTVVFQDNFEGASPVSAGPAPDFSAQYNPVAQVGTWNVSDPSWPCVQVTNSTTSPDPGPAPTGGSQYLRVYRSSANNDHDLNAFPTATQGTNGDHIRLSMMVWIPSGAANVNARMQVALVGSSNNFDTACAWVRPDGNGHVIAVGPYYGLTDTGLTYTPGTWQKWDLDYVVGDSTFSVTVNGVTASNLSSIYDGGVVSAKFGNGSDTTGSFYLDGVLGDKVTLQGTINPAGYTGDLGIVGVGIELIQGTTVVKTVKTVLSENGTFSIYPVTPGTYDIAIKGTSWLRKVVHGLTTNADPWVITPITLDAGGDCDGDNHVSSTDLAIVLGNME